MIRFRGQSQEAHLATLPTDIYYLLIKNLDRVSTTCLALACKPVYEIHMKTRGKVSLCAWSPVDQTRLYQKLALWMPVELFIASVDKFVTKERQEVLATTRVNLVGEWYWEPKDMWKATKVFKEEKGKDMDEEVEREGLVVLSVSNAGASKKRSFFKMNDEDHENL